MAFSLCATLGAGAACSQSADAGSGPTATPVRLRIAALGDSLTSGHGIGRDRAYPALLEEALRDAGLPYAVSNHGVSGDTTAGGVRRLASALDEGPQILIVALGANDGLRGVPVVDVRRNLEQIIESAQERGVAVLLCGMEALPLYGWQYTLDFHRIYPELAAKYGIPLVPFLLNGVIGNRAMMQPDLVHPNAAGAQAIAANIWPYLQPMAAAAAAGS
jgi:acyl-CoA thioesterase-1